VATLLASSNPGASLSQGCTLLVGWLFLS